MTAQKLFNSNKKVISSGFKMLMITQEINHKKILECINFKHKLIGDLSSNND